MKKSLSIFFLVFSLLFFSTAKGFSQSNCDQYPWVMVKSSEMAASIWSICPDKIDFSLTVTTPSFHFYYTKLFVVQNGKQFITVSGDPDEGRALMHCDGCFGEIKEGVTLNGWIDTFPSWFNIFSPFTIYFYDSDIDVNGAPIPPTTTTTSINITTTTIPISTTTTAPANQCAAETIYGSNSEETELLREYRDKVLSKSATGRQIIKTYYQLSPAVVEVIQNNDTAEENARRVLDSIMPAIREKVKQ